MKYFKNCLFFVFSLLCFSCTISDNSEELLPEICVPQGEVDGFQKDIVFESEGGEQYLSFSSNVDWKLFLATPRNGQSWCTVYPDGGKAGKCLVRIKAEKNEEVDDRSVALTLQAETLQKTINVVQKGEESLTVTKNKFTVSPKGGTVEVEVNANVDYQVVISESCQRWIHRSEKQGRGISTSRIHFEVDATEEYEKREGEILIQSGHLKEKIHVYQSGQGVLLLSRDKIVVSSAEEVIEVQVNSNFKFDVHLPQVDWLSECQQYRGMSSHTLYFKVAANESYDNRQAEIIFSDAHSNLKDTLTIQQCQKDALILSQKKVEVKGEGDTFSVTLGSNIDYEVSMDVPWMTQIPKSRGLAEHTILFQVAANETPKEREGKITFRNKEKGILECVVVKQSGVLPAEEKAMIFVARANMSNDFTVTLPISSTWGHKMECTVDWGNGTIRNYEQTTGKVGSSTGPISYSYDKMTPTTYEIKVYGNVPALSMIHSYIFDTEEVKHSIVEVKQWGHTGLLEICDAFKDSDYLTKIAGDSNGSFRDVRYFDKTFSNCTALPEIPEDLFAFAEEATSFCSTFEGCTALTSIPCKLFANCKKAESFEGVFAHCEGLNEIPDYLFAGCAEVTTFDKVFYDCDGIISIPPHLFEGCSGANSFGRTFQYCDNIQDIPGRLFQDCKGNIDFNSTFYYCQNLRSLPENLFNGCEGKCHFYQTFGSCYNLTAIPYNLFEGCINATNFNETFSECKSLKTVPKGLFKDCKNATDFYGTFRDCKDLVTVQAGAFEGCTKAERFGQTFYQCSNLKQLSGDMFKGCTSVKTFYDTFYGCGLHEIPEHLFDDCTEVTNFESTFGHNSNLESIPTTLFDHNRKVIDFSWTFSGCSKVIGESPYTLIDGEKCHLYDRYKYKDYFVTPKEHAVCFGGCTQLSDYEQIPEDW